jgi:hypothetical protein
LDLRELLAPRLAMKKPIRWSDEEVDTDERTSIRQLIDWQIELSVDQVQLALGDPHDDCWATALTLLLDDFDLLLQDSLDLLR